MTKENTSVTAQDLEEIWGEKLSDYTKKKVEEYNLVYSELSQEERDSWIFLLIKTIFESRDIIKAGKHRHSQWEKGWGENLKLFSSTKELDCLSPRYFGKYNAVRWRSDLVKPTSKDFEKNSLSIIQNWLFDKYLRSVSSIYEFGCGTGHNLFRAQEVNPSASLYGLDWAEASKNIIETLKKENLLRKASGHCFDFFDPDPNFHLDENSGVYTVAALEQIGPNFEKFINYLINEKPQICIHIEPITELLDKTKILDYLSIKYFELRNYLSGFLTYLKKLENEGKIKIHQAQRTYTGSLFIEGHSVVVWSPSDL